MIKSAKCFVRPRGEEWEEEEIGLNSITRDIHPASHVGSTTLHTVAGRLICALGE